MSPDGTTACLAFWIIASTCLHASFNSSGSSCATFHRPVKCTLRCRACIPVPSNNGAHTLELSMCIACSNVSLTTGDTEGLPRQRPLCQHRSRQSTPLVAIRRQQAQGGLPRQCPLCRPYHRRHRCHRSHHSPPAFETRESFRDVRHQFCPPVSNFWKIHFRGRNRQEAQPFSQDSHIPAHHRHQSFQFGVQRSHRRHREAIAAILATVAIDAIVVIESHRRHRSHPPSTSFDTHQLPAVRLPATAVSASKCESLNTSFFTSFLRFKTATCSRTVPLSAWSGFPNRTDQTSHQQFLLPQISVRFAS